MTDGRREILAELERDARECGEELDEDWAGNFVSAEAERANSEAILYAMEANAIAADWTSVGDDDEIEPW